MLLARAPHALATSTLLHSLHVIVVVVVVVVVAAISPTYHDPNVVVSSSTAALSAHSLTPLASTAHTHLLLLLRRVTHRLHAVISSSWCPTRSSSGLTSEYEWCRHLSLCGLLLPHLLLGTSTLLK